MKTQKIVETMRGLNFTQSFFAFIVLIQLSLILVSIFMRVFVEFGLFKLSFDLYVLFLVFGIVVMMLFLFGKKGRSGSYFSVSLVYFLIACSLLILISKNEGGIFSALSIGTSVLVTWSSANFFFSIVMLMVTLVRLLLLGLSKDYSVRDGANTENDTVSVWKKEIKTLKETVDKLRNSKR